MNKIDFSASQEALIKHAAENLDCDEATLRGFFKYADEQYAAWCTIIDRVPEYKDPAIRKQAAYEFVAATTLNKQANTDFLQSLQRQLGDVGSGIGELFGTKGGAGLGGLVGGGAGGGLIGILLAKLLGLPIGVGMALGALLGSGAGYMFGNADLSQLGQQAAAGQTTPIEPGGAAAGQDSLVGPIKAQPTNLESVKTFPKELASLNLGNNTLKSPLASGDGVRVNSVPVTGGKPVVPDSVAPVSRPTAAPAIPQFRSPGGGGNPTAPQTLSTGVNTAPPEIPTMQSSPAQRAHIGPMQPPAHRR